MRTKMLNIKIPPNYINSYTEFGLLSEGELKGVIAVLNSHEIGDGPNGLALKLSEVLNSVKNIGLFASALFAFGSFGSDVAVGNTDEEIIDALIRSYSIQKKEYECDVKQLKLNLQAFFESIINIKLSYKAGTLYNSAHLIYTSSQIVTDVRPIFQDDVEIGSANALIIHQMRIDAAKQDGEDSFFIQMDLEDLNKLKEQIERAISKEHAIRSSQSDMKMVKRNNKGLNFVSIKA